MPKIAIGKTGLFAEDTGFGALPIQRIPKEDAVFLLRMAFDGGITYFDTSRAYTDSEEKMGAAFPPADREKIIIATKTMHFTEEGFWSDLHTSLKMLGTDYIDIYQFHNPPFVPKPGDGRGLYECMLKAKEQGKIRHIAITNHRLDLAFDAVKSGLYETMQFPFNYLSTDKEIQLVKETLEAGMGFICMKGMSGGLITSGRAATVWMRRYPGVMPIWGVQRKEELEEFLKYISEPPQDDEEIKSIIEGDRNQLQGEFCRSCGYCMPCPVGIEIGNAARMSLLLRRAPTANNLGPEGQAMMNKIDDCLECGQCASKCPYGLDTPNLLKRNLKDYREVLAGKPILPHNY
jgi:predicted aldo/keto reductase-like oxidoreductase